MDIAKYGPPSLLRSILSQRKEFSLPLHPHFLYIRRFLPHLYWVTPVANISRLRVLSVYLPGKQLELSQSNTHMVYVVFKCQEQDTNYIFSKTKT